MLRLFRYAFRQLRESPGFAATAVLMLIFGMGSSTAIFAVLDAVLLEPLLCAARSSRGCGFPTRPHCFHPNDAGLSVAVDDVQQSRCISSMVADSEDNRCYGGSSDSYRVAVVLLDAGNSFRTRNKLADHGE